MRTFFALLAALLLAPSPQAQPTGKPNILFISIDDLRTELGCYGSDIAVTPHMDALAQQGLRFNNAYCQQAICGPSRASLLTGLRPDTIGITHNYVKIREQAPDVVTLPQYFGNRGYDTVAFGKIFHPGDRDPASWNRQPQVTEEDAEFARSRYGFALTENRENTHQSRQEMFAKYGEVAKYGLAMGPAYEAADVPDNRYIDGHSTDLAIATMRQLVAEGDKPFFLGLGLYKPHLNWIAPKRYWDLYNPDDITLATQTTAPENGAAMGLHASFELRVRQGIPKSGGFDPELARTLKHAYLACTSYIDAQVGRMIAALEEEGVRDNTIIILWSDHGFHLGEKGVWGKATNYELATRVPMIIWTPDMPASTRGRSTDALVELIDMYPTLCELAGLDSPTDVEGHSFAPLVHSPDTPWKTAAFSQFPNPALREWGAFPLRPAMRETFFGPLIEDVEARIKQQFPDRWDRDLFENRLMGYSMRTAQHRLIIWIDQANPDAEPLFVELYDHTADPEETVNVAAEQPGLVVDLIQQFRRGWQGNLPPQ
ncbi:sulfatase [Algisphaera agarilytica]|uniref:Arylsulfatase A-like enzyme n=1 Tax=Algisphaera agarilytica TaxID=1385975 RepID=A0A7X0H407_9BACT|nr:sulfatase [Algisphaera agarilytica]MBB6428861.1 arylsulfatase A-like enzyme [Algisphaera agarilytica]